MIKMSIPPILFKYQSFTPEALSNLASRQIWFSRPAKFNDPFDCSIRIDRGPISDLDYQRVYEFCRNESGDPSGFDAQYSPLAYKNSEFRKQIQTGLDAAFENQRQIMLNKNGVCCFSASNNEILMWSHYADSHKGFCLGFKTNTEPFSGALKVAYKADVPAINPVSILLGNVESALHLMTLTKHISWRYEKEWRLLHMEADKVYGYSAGILESIYFGVLMPESQQIVIGKLLGGTGTKYYRMVRDSTKFSVRPEPITFNATPRE